MRVWFETDRVLPEIAMIARGNPTKSARKKVASTEGGSTQAAMPSQARPIVRIKGPRKFAPLPFLQSQLLPDLISAGLITSVPPKAPPSPLPTWYDPNARCEYHMQGRGHWTYDCYDLKHKIQDLIDQDLWSPYVSPISRPERGFDPSQLITRPGTRVRVRFEEDLPEVSKAKDFLGC